MAELADKKCTACQGEEDKLSVAETEELLGDVPSWELNEDGWLTREYECEDFIAAMSFVQQVALVAEAEFHHPNIAIHDWNQVTLEIYTHKIDGLTESDFVLAAKINELQQ